jgi:hypothetical protein
VLRVQPISSSKKETVWRELKNYEVSHHIYFPFSCPLLFLFPTILLNKCFSCTCIIAYLIRLVSKYLLAIVTVSVGGLRESS